MTSNVTLDSGGRANLKIEENRNVLFGGLGAAIVASAGLIWLVSESALLAATFFAGVSILALVVFVFSQTTSKQSFEELAPPDWSVTVAAIEQPGIAIAITDRANRLTCANSAFSSWFPAGIAPPNLPLDRASLE
ncbi:MAG: hybrid sensor histidine kinase/response regulator, partial [Pontixanthobacter sp.]